MHSIKFFLQFTLNFFGCFELLDFLSNFLRFVIIIAKFFLNYFDLFSQDKLFLVLSQSIVKFFIDFFQYAEFIRLDLQRRRQSLRSQFAISLVQIRLSVNISYTVCNYIHNLRRVLHSFKSKPYRLRNRCAQFLKILDVFIQQSSIQIILKRLVKRNSVVFFYSNPNGPVVFIYNIYQSSSLNAF